MKQRTRNLLLHITTFVLALTLLFAAVPVRAIAASQNNRKIVNAVFVLDNTSSMGDEIGNVKKNLKTFASYLEGREGLDGLRIGLIEFGDYAIGEKTTVHKNSSGSPWFEDIDELITEIDGIALGAGGDTPETPLDGLGYLVSGWGSETALPFNSDAYKFAFLLTDADYKTTNRFGISGMSDMVSRLKSAGIYTSVVTSSSYKSTYASLFGYAPDGAVLDEHGEPFTGEWMDINGDFSANMRQFADRILDVVRPDIEEITLEVGASFNFYSFASVYLDSPEDAVYESDDEGVLSFSEIARSVGTAKEEGHCNVTITDGAGTVVVEVTVVPGGEVVVPVKELHISTEVIVGVDQSIYIKAVALPEEATEKGLIWRVDNTNIVQIVESDSNRCYLKGLQSGTAKLTALTVDGGYSGYAMITVTLDPIKSVTGVELSMSECTLSVGERETVTGKVTPEDATNQGGYWYSTNPSVVKIVSAENGECTFEAVLCGEAKIYFVSDEGGYSECVSVTVPHSGAWTDLRPATCGEAGERAYICSVCHAVLMTDTIPATGAHSFSDWRIVPYDGDVLQKIERSCTVCEETETADVGAMFYTAPIKGRVGETLEAELRIREGAYLSDFQFKFTYNSELFDVKEAKFSEEMTAAIKNITINREEGTITVLYSGMDLITEDTAIMTISFEIKEGAAYKAEKLFSLDPEAHNVCHLMLGGQTYAIGYAFDHACGEVVIYGSDPNGDGELNIHDLYDMLLVLTSASYDPDDAELLERMDCNGDGVFDIADITYLQYIITYLDR